ncbi:MAG: nucleotidyltransferase substrate binding protein [Deltaproteobacteria bacterium]|nr:nucleotidyltransferase substrate binding protein [Deltaproteobacteria bacterium]
MTKLAATIKQFETALMRLKEALAVEKTDIVRDSAIQRFEFTLDLAWKMLKAFLEDKKGIICVSPKECFREAYRQGIIDYDEEWIKFVDMRNETVHTYNEEIAEKIYVQLSNALKHFEGLLDAIRKNL